MIILALETAITPQSVAVLQGQRLLGYLECEPARPLTSQLIPTIDRLLTSISLQASDLEGLAVSLGPGTFTGLRAGLATMTAFRFALNLPLVGVSTLEGLVWNHPCSDLPLLSTVRIRPGIMYWALFRWVDQQVVCLKEAQIGEVNEVLSAVSEPTRVFGDGWMGDWPSGGLKEFPLIEVPASGLWPSAIGVGLGGQILLDKGMFLPQGCTPQYIQPSYAELSKSTRPNSTG